MESKNATLRRQLDDQESFVEQLGSELSKQEKLMKEILRKENKSSSSSTQPTSKWGDSVQDLLKGGGAFHTNSTMKSALASTGAPLFDTITNTQYQGNVGILQLASFGRTSGGGDGAKNAGGTGNGDGKDNKGKSDNPDVGQGEGGGDPLLHRRPRPRHLLRPHRRRVQVTVLRLVRMERKRKRRKRRRKTR